MKPIITIEKDGPVDARIIPRSSARAIPGADAILAECVGRSAEVWKGFVDGKIACAWGLIPPTLLSTAAWLWLLETDLINDHKFIFIRNSQRYIEDALTRYPEIIGEVRLDNRRGMRWLRWLGAEFTSTHNGCLSFVIRKK